MNYRKWKKRYKKRYGVNPPASADKKKQRKQAVKAFIAFTNSDFSATISRATALMTEYIADAMRTLGRVADNSGTAFRKIADTLQPIEIKNQNLSWEVKRIVCDWGIYENNARDGSSKLKLIVNSRRAADKIVEILQQDELESVRFNNPDRIQRKNGIPDSTRAAIITAYESGAFGK
jgi:hypothetical protein